MILENSKHFMYNFWYNSLLKLFGYANVDLCFSDTDSFCFLLKCKNGYFSALQKLTPYLDFSNYDPSHPFFSKKKEKALGFFKDELKGTQIAKKFCGLRAKCYAIEYANNDSKLVCKGVGKTAIKNRIHFSQYYNALFENKIYRHEYSAIESKNHSLHTVLRKKKSLSNFDSKRFILPCGIHSVPFGSSLISLYKNTCYKCEN